MSRRDRLAGAATLAMDNLLQHPDTAAAVAELVRANTPLWLRDQIDAAGRNISAGLDRAAAEYGGTPRPTTADDHSAWVRLGALSALTGWAVGGGSTCIHSPNPHCPEPIVAAAWRPGLVACGRCTHLLQLPRHGVADRTCDGCGYITTGTDNDDAIWPVVVQVGLLTYLLGCCQSCKYWTDTGGDRQHGE